MPFRVWFENGNIGTIKNTLRAGYTIITCKVEMHFFDFFCVGVMYSGEYDACDVTLSVYPHRVSLKNMKNITSIIFT